MKLDDVFKEFFRRQYTSIFENRNKKRYTKSQTYTFKENWACRFYGHCSRCPFLDYHFCTFKEKEEE